ncbi:MAG: hypothetical protein R3F42_09015 [Pseudomonadota bacterium]
MALRANILGDVRAEADGEMLKIAFYETPDYRTLIESADRTVVVGRRGTGKSALASRLDTHWKKAQKTLVLNLAANEDQIIGIRPLIKLFGEEFKLVRAGSRIAWRYALLIEAAEALSRRYKYQNADGSQVLDKHLVDWKNDRYGFCSKLKEKLRKVVNASVSPEERISDLARNLEIGEVEEAIQSVLDATNFRLYVLIDRLDEGYEPDETGIGLIDGLVHAVIDVNTKFQNIRTLVFLRDNIFRAVSKSDPDFSRNIEGQTLRLHWDEYGLFNLVANRLKVAFGLDQENTVRIWDSCAARDLKGREGFRTCLRLTLYRPRDLLILLNEAFRVAGKQEREQIIGDDIEATAKGISKNRLDDLEKEYSAIFPGLSLFVSALSNKNPEMQVSEASSLFREILNQDTYDQKIQQQLAIMQSPIDVLRDLYRVGLIGVFDDATSNFVFLSRWQGS